MEKKSLFIASPISVFESEEEFSKFHGWLQKLIDEIRADNFFENVFCAAEQVSSNNEIDDPVDSVIEDIAEIEKATSFLLIYPKKSPTSALIELGYALAKNKNIVIARHAESPLPFMATKLDRVYDTVKLLTYLETNSKSISEISSMLRLS